jgi:aspartate/methionine/tyrosine aminotransferase
MFSRRTSWNLTPNAFTRALEAHRRGGGQLLDLTASNPTQTGLQYDTKAILEALARPDGLRYHPEPKGLPAAREAVAGYYRDLAETYAASGPAGPDAQVPADSILLTVSTSEAYSFVFRLLCNPDDEILVPTPSYPLFEFLAGLQDVKLTPYSLFYDHGWHIDFHSVEKALTPRTRAIILVHPNNPTGSYVSRPEAEQLNELCRQRDLALVVDEVFLDYSLRGPQFSFAFNRAALTFTLSGISKISGLPQMKLAWLAASGPEALLVPAMSRLEMIADTYLSMSAPIQHAAPVLLAQRHGVRQQLMARVGVNLAELDRQLAAQALCSRLEVEGGWYAVLRAPATRSDEDLAIALLHQRNVLVQPGYFYDFHADGYLVISLITPEAEFAEGVRRALEFLKDL